MEDDIIGFLEYAKSQLDMAKQEIRNTRQPMPSKQRQSITG